MLMESFIDYGIWIGNITKLNPMHIAFNIIQLYKEQLSDLV